jgi:hypothetical protein
VHRPYAQPNKAVSCVKARYRRIPVRFSPHPDTLPGGPPIPIGDPWVLHASAADKIVALTSPLRRAATAPDPAAFWARRRAFRALVPYFRAFHTTAAPHLPTSMAAGLDLVVVQAEQAAPRHGPPSPPPRTDVPATPAPSR